MAVKVLSDTINWTPLNGIERLRVDFALMLALMRERCGTLLNSVPR